MNQKQPIPCPLCGNRFAPEARTCAACPLAGKGCERVCCPHCRYSFPAESKLVNWLKKLLPSKPELPLEEEKP